MRLHEPKGISLSADKMIVTFRNDNETSTSSLNAARKSLLSETQADSIKRKLEKISANPPTRLDKSDNWKRQKNDKWKEVRERAFKSASKPSDGIIGDQDDDFQVEEPVKHSSGLDVRNLLRTTKECSSRHYKVPVSVQFSKSEPDVDFQTPARLRRRSAMPFTSPLTLSPSVIGEG